VELTFGVDNQISTVRRGLAETRYQYDGWGRRIRKVGPTGSIEYLLAGIERRSLPDGTVQYRRRIAVGDLSVAESIRTVDGSEEVLYLIPDHLGSCRVVTNGEGHVVSRVSYAPFGKADRISGPTSRWFTGQEYEPDERWYNFGARMYDPELGRFLSPDSIVPDPFNPQALNRYAYVFNNPLGFVDPTGHSPEGTIHRRGESESAAPPGFSVVPKGDVKGWAGAAKQGWEAIQDGASWVGGKLKDLFTSDDDGEGPPAPPQPGDIPWSGRGEATDPNPASWRRWDPSAWDRATGWLRENGWIGNHGADNCSEFCKFSHRPGYLRMATDALTPGFGRAAFSRVASSSTFWWRNIFAPASKFTTPGHIPGVAIRWSPVKSEWNRLFGVDRRLYPSGKATWHVHVLKWVFGDHAGSLWRW
jgi:RHS repeat-associated protein